MRHLMLLTLVASSCTVGFQPDPPLLEVLTPQRSLIQDQAGPVTVTGTVAPNPTGAPVAKVSVNGVQATVKADGTWTATIDVPIGATLIHTIASDQAGGLATDTRSVLAGERRAPGQNVESAIGASISAPAFAKLAGVATSALKAANLTQLITPMNPVARSGDEAGPDCLYAQGFVDSVAISDASISLVPVTGGLRITATLQQPRITGHTKHAVACVDGSSQFVITASSATLGGVLKLKTNGMMGFVGELADPVVQLPGLDITATNFPDALLNVLPLERIIQAVAPIAVRQFVDPAINEALGALAGPQQLQVLERAMTVQVAPRAITFDDSGATALLDLKMLIAGAENSPGYTFTPNGIPPLTSDGGIALGIADDLANDALAQLTATGLLNLNLKQEGAEFNTAKVTATTPPVIAADGTDGKLRVIVPDLMVTFLDRDVPVSRAAVNAQIPISISPVDGGSSIAIELGTPAIAIDTLDDLTGLEMPPDSEFARTITLAAGQQQGAIAEVLKRIPLPKLGGITLSDVSVSGANGYVTAKTKIQ
jgi:hypothetical protein